MPYVIYDKSNFSKIAVVNTLQEATNLLPNDNFDILEMEDSNDEIYKEGNKIKTRKKQKNRLSIKCKLMKKS